MGGDNGSVWRKAFRHAVFDIIRFMERFFDVMTIVFGFVMKIIGPVFMCLALVLIGSVTYGYFWHVLPNLKLNVAAKSLLTFSGVFLLVNILYNYGKAVLTDPGLPPEYKEDGEVELGPNKPHQCKKCDRVKPPRAHHCSVCRRCVLKMDHHCPWINNCVGFGNYRHFCLFLLYLALGCLWVGVVYWPFFMNLRLLGPLNSLEGRQARKVVVMSFMIVCSIFIAMCILGGFHVILVLTNQTTIEFQTNMVKRRTARREGTFFRNCYDTGRSRNFQQVFGPNRFWTFLWMLPYIAAPPTGTGLDFPSLSKVDI